MFESEICDLQGGCYGNGEIGFGMLVFRLVVFALAIYGLGKLLESLLGNRDTK